MDEQTVDNEIGNDLYLGDPLVPENLLNLLDCTVVAIQPSTDFQFEVFDLVCQVITLTT